MAGRWIDAVRVVHQAWERLGDRRTILGVTESSANVSTNRVYRVALSDGTSVFAKVSNYGSYFLFREDHDRIFRWNRLLGDTRYRTLLADPIVRDGRPWIYYDREVWAIFYLEVPLGERLPPRLSDEEVENLAEEMARFHLQCAQVAPRIPPTSKSIKSDAVNLLEALTNPFSSARFRFDDGELRTAIDHCHGFLLALEDIGYDDVARMPVLIDWNLGNFSVQRRAGGRFELYSRWDYDWFRIESRALDFYFLSRVSSSTGDRTEFTYSPHTLLEPRFARFLRAYHQIFPLTPAEIDLIAQSYRFFVLNYVLREGEAFFQRDLSRRFAREAVNVYLPAFERFDVEALHRCVAG